MSACILSLFWHRDIYTIDMHERHRPFVLVVDAYTSIVVRESCVTLDPTVGSPCFLAPSARCASGQVLGISDTSWNSMKKFLGNRKVKEQILSFDARSLTGPIRKQVQKIMQVGSLPPASVCRDFAPPRVPYVRVYTHVRMAIFSRLCMAVP